MPPRPLDSAGLCWNLALFLGNLGAGLWCLSYQQKDVWTLLACVSSCCLTHSFTHSLRSFLLFSSGIFPGGPMPPRPLDSAGLCLNLALFLGNLGAGLWCLSDQQKDVWTLLACVSCFFLRFPSHPHSSIFFFFCNISWGPHAPQTFGLCRTVLELGSFLG